ncbi:long-chain fatty acid--CoA ligase [Parasphingorhabdus pacifica]
MPFPVPPVLGDRIGANVSYPGGSLSGRELLARAYDAARRLPTGSRIAVDADDALTRLCWLLGADIAGCATLLIEPAWSASERRSVLADARPAMTVGASWPSAAVDTTGTRYPVGDESTRFYLPTTSGSSGRPRVLVRSRRSWLRSFEAFDIGTGADDRVLVPGPLTSSLFLFGAVHALHEDLDLHLLDRWSAADAAEECRWATVLHVVPAMLSALVSRWEADAALRHGCTLRTIACGGARVDPVLRERLHHVLPDCDLVEYYGSAEHSVVAMHHGEAMRPVVEVDVRDERGDSLSPDEPGVLWARSELLFDGYLRHGELDSSETGEDGWSSVGGQAVLHHDGTLTVHGRSGSTISTGARLVTAEEVESVLRRAPGVGDVIVAATPHPRLGSLVTALIEADGPPPALRALRGLVRDELEPAKRPRRWLVTHELPRTSAGKPARGLVAENLRTGVPPGEPLT